MRVPVLLLVVASPWLCMRLRVGLRGAKSESGSSSQCGARNAYRR